MVRIVLLSDMDLSTHALTPGITLYAFGVCLDLIGGETLASNQSLYLIQIVHRGCTSMHFGEYELSPSLISLSPLPTRHPKIFQHSPVRSSIPCYRNFNLHMGGSLGFASTTADSIALFRLAFAPAS